MKRIGIFLFIGTLIVGVIASNFVSFGRVSGKVFDFPFLKKSHKGSGVLATEIRDIAEFRGLKVGGVFEVEASLQGGYAIEVSADDNLLPFIRTEVHDGILHIKSDRKISSENPMVVKISAPDLTVMDVSGAAVLNVTGVNNENLTVDSSGASKISLAGETSRLSIDASGAAYVNASQVAAKSASVEGSGASRINVSVREELRSEASGASQVVYQGTPAKITRKTSGAASVSQQ